MSLFKLHHQISVFIFTPAAWDMLSVQLVHFRLTLVLIRSRLEWKRMAAKYTSKDIWPCTYIAQLFVVFLVRMDLALISFDSRTSVGVSLALQ